MRRRRVFLVGMRARINNRVHAELVRRGIDLGVPLFTQEGVSLMEGLSLDAVDQMLPLIEALNQQIRRINVGLRRMIREDECA